MTRHIHTMRAVHANAGVQQWYDTELRGLVLEAYMEVLRIVSGHTPRTVVPRAQQLFALDAGPIDDLDKQLKAWAKKWGVRFDTISATLAKKFTKRSFNATEVSMQAALKAAGFTVKFQPTRASLEAYKATLAWNVGLIRNLPAQYVAGVQSAVWASVNRGGDMAQLSARLRKEYDLTIERAALIARDQNNKAKATIEKTRRLELGITRGIWQHSSAGREPRHTHVKMDGKEFEIAVGMYDSDENAYVQPGELINCRCTSRAIFPELA